MMALPQVARMAVRRPCRAGVGRAGPPCRACRACRAGPACRAAVPSVGVPSVGRAGVGRNGGGPGQPFALAILRGWTLHAQRDRQRVRFGPRGARRPRFRARPSVGGDESFPLGSQLEALRRAFRTERPWTKNRWAQGPQGLARRSLVPSKRQTARFGRQDGAWSTMPTAATRRAERAPRFIPTHARLGTFIPRGIGQSGPSDRRSRRLSFWGNQRAPHGSEGTQPRQPPRDLHGGRLYP